MHLINKRRALNKHHVYVATPPAFTRENTVYTYIYINCGKGQ